MKMIRISVLAMSALLVCGAYAATAAADWIAIAGASWRDGDGVAHSAIGYSGVRQSQGDAKESAIDACESSDGQGCKILGAWSNGCIYITTGSSDERAGYGAGPSAEEAIANCRNEGLSCEQPVGGCID